MKISKIINFSNYNSFKSANISINSFSDTHGEMLLADSALDKIQQNKNDIFLKNEQGNANILAVCGDWFMNGNQKGYSNNPKKPLAKFQLEIFNELINQIKLLAGGRNFTSLFLPGNHEFDSDITLLDEVLSELNAETILTNLNLSDSPALIRSTKRRKVINEKIVEVEDSKNPNLTHRILFLGVCPVNMSAYQTHLTGVDFLDNINKSRHYIDKSDYKKTFNDCITRINKFKKNNPNGIVILLSHTGANFADNLVQQAPVDLVFDGHEHLDDIRFVNKTPIIPLSQNFRKTVNAKLKINDDGHLESITLKTLFPDNSNCQGVIAKLYHKLFSADLEEKYYIKPENPEVQELDTSHVRTGNNFLANFVTDSILEELNKIYSQVDFFALNSSSIRHSLSTSIDKKNSKFNVLNVLSGIREDQSQIFLTELNGRELLKMVLDNYKFNNESPENNTIIHYSGLIIDRTNLMQAYENGAPDDDLYQYIVNANDNTPINPNKKYIIANAEKYFDKNPNKEIKAMKSKSIATGRNVHELFLEHFENSNGNLTVKCDVRIK